jgi:Domain of unknown function (DUF5130)
MSRPKGFTADDRFAIDVAIRYLEQRTRFEVSVFVGAARGDTRRFAESLHAVLVAPERSVLVLVDPAARQAEVVTGRLVRRAIPDLFVRTVLAEMCLSFADGKVVRGLVCGLRDFVRRNEVPPEEQPVQALRLDARGWSGPRETERGSRGAARQDTEAGREEPDQAESSTRALVGATQPPG